MDGHRPAVWISDRYTAQQGRAAEHRTCLAHLARNVAYAVETSDDPVLWRLQLRLRSVFALAGRVATSATSTPAAKRRSTRARVLSGRDQRRQDLRRQDLRRSLDRRRQARTARTRFRRDPDTYLSALERQAHQPALPS